MTLTSKHIFISKRDDKKFQIAIKKFNKIMLKAKKEK